MHKYDTADASQSAREDTHNAFFLLSAFASRTVLCVAPDSGPPEVVQTNKDRLHSCWLHQHVCTMVIRQVF